MYAQWLRAHALSARSLIFSDSSAHRVISDLSVFISKEYGHRVLAAGDLNILRGYGEHGSAYWAARHNTVFDRMKALGLPCIGPEHPNGRQADPWPDELPRDSRNVPTFHSNRQSPATAARQLDYVFASKGLADSLEVRALNRPEEWGRAITVGSRLSFIAPMPVEHTGRTRHVWHVFPQSREGRSLLFPLRSPPSSRGSGLDSTGR